MANNTELKMTGFAPYNFIPFYTGEVPIRYERDAEGKDELPAFNAQADGVLSGYVDYKIRVLTDLAVGDSLSLDAKNAGESRRFYRDVQNNLVIPGSEMRGLVRSAAEILSLARPEMVSDERYMYRKIASNCTKARKEYTSELAAERPRKGEKSDSKTQTPAGVEAGLITLTRQGGYVIKPLETIPNTRNTFLRISEKTLRKAMDTIHLDESHLLYLDEDCQKENPDYHPYRGVEVQFRYETTKYGGAIRFDVKQGTGTKGTLLNSANILNDQKNEHRTFKDGTPFPIGKSHHYLVSGVEASKRPGIKVDPADARAYQHDYERNCIQNKDIERYSEFYALPGRVGESKVFFYKMEGTQLVGFGPTPYFRLFYRYSLRDGLPMIYDRSKGIDYVTAMFGFLGEGSQAGYKSRLSFQNAILAGDTVRGEDLVVRDFALLGPKGSAFDMYLEQEGRSLKGENNDGLLDYNDDRFHLRGSKIYWKRSKALIPEAPGDNTAVLSHLEVLKAGRQDKYFAGRVYFDNLHEDELGLLLLGLQYDSSKQETRLLGSAKPYGYGKVAITVEGLRILCDKERFTAVNPAARDAKGEAENYKAAFKEAINRELRKNAENMPGYEELPTIKVYRAWLENDHVDEALDHKGYVYMPVQKTGGVANYGNCEPMPLAQDILGVDVDRPERIANKVADKRGAAASNNDAASKGYTAGDDAQEDTRPKKSGCVRMVVLDYGKGQEVFNVKPTTDDDAVKAFHKMPEVKCYYNRHDADYEPNPKSLQKGAIILARPELVERKNKRSKKTEKVLVAVDWYTEKE